MLAKWIGQNSNSGGMILQNSNSGGMIRQNSNSGGMIRQNLKNRAIFWIPAIGENARVFDCKRQQFVLPVEKARRENVALCSRCAWERLGNGESLQSWTAAHVPRQTMASVSQVLRFKPFWFGKHVVWFDDNRHPFGCVERQREDHQRLWAFHEGALLSLDIPTQCWAICTHF